MLDKKVFIIISWGILVAILAFFAGSYLKQNKTGYPKGTVIETYESLPPDLPSDILAEKYPVKDISLTKYPKGGEDIYLSYVSPKILNDVVSLYADHLWATGWSIKTQKNQSDLGVISAVKDNMEMSITFLPKDSGTELNLIYKRAK